MDRATMPGRALLTKTETINWIAFGKAVDADLTGHESIMAKWWLDAPYAPNGMLLALRAIADGVLFWTPRPIPPGWPDFMPAAVPPSYAELDARARRMVSAKGRSAQELADELESDLIAFAHLSAAYDDAKIKLNDAELERRVSYVPPSDIPDFIPYKGRGDNVVWYRKGDVLALWPMPGGNPREAPAPLRANANAARVTPRGVDYKAQDQPLIEEMHRMLTANPAKAQNKWDAALIVSESAQGTGTGASKAKRLMLKYSAAFSAERDGKD